MALEDQLLDDFMHLLPEYKNQVIDFVHALRQKQEVIQPTDSESSELSAYDVFKDLGMIGCIKGGPKDLSYNKDYLEGYGQ